MVSIELKNASPSKPYDTNHLSILKHRISEHQIYYGDAFKVVLRYVTSRQCRGEAVYDCSARVHL